MSRSGAQISRFVRATGAVLAGLCLILAVGCTSGVYCYCSLPRQVHLRIVVAGVGPERLVVVLEPGDGTEARPDAQGRVTLSVPTLRGCKHVTFGILVQADGPLFETLVHIQRDGVDLCALTLAELEALPLDVQRCHVLELDD